MRVSVLSGKRFFRCLCKHQKVQKHLCTYAINCHSFLYCWRRGIKNALFDTETGSLTFAMLLGAVPLQYYAIFTLIWVTDIACVTDDSTPNQYERQLATLVANFHFMNAKSEGDGQWITTELFDGLEKALSTILQRLSEHCDASPEYKYDWPYFADVCSLTPRCLDFVHVFGSNGGTRSETLRLYDLHERLCLNLSNWPDIQSTVDDNEGHSPPDPQQALVGDVTDDSLNEMDGTTTTIRNLKRTDVIFVTKAFDAINGINKRCLLSWTWDLRDDVWESLVKAAAKEAIWTLAAAAEAAVKAKDVAEKAMNLVNAMASVALESKMTIDRVTQAIGTKAIKMSEIMVKATEDATPMTLVEKTTMMAETMLLMGATMTKTKSDVTLANDLIFDMMKQTTEALQSVTTMLKESSNGAAAMIKATSAMTMDLNVLELMDEQIRQLNAEYLQKDNVSERPATDGVIAILVVRFQVLETTFNQEVMKEMDNEVTMTNNKDLSNTLSNLSSSACRLMPPVLAYLSRTCQVDLLLYTSKFFGIYLTMCADWMSFLDTHCPSVPSDKRPSAKRQWWACAKNAIADRLLVNHYSVFQDGNNTKPPDNLLGYTSDEALKYMTALHDIVAEHYSGDKAISTPGQVWTTSERLFSRYALARSRFDGIAQPLLNRKTTIDDSVSIDLFGAYRLLIPWRADMSAALDFHDLVNEHTNAVIDDYLFLHALTIDLYLSRFNLASVDDSQLQRLRETVDWYTVDAQIFREYLSRPGTVKCFPITVKDVIEAVQGLNRNKSTENVLHDKVRHALDKIPDWADSDAIRSLEWLNDTAVSFCRNAENLMNSFLNQDYSSSSKKKFQLRCDKYVNDVFVQLAIPVTFDESNTAIPVKTDESRTTIPVSDDKIEKINKPVDTGSDE